MIWKLNSVDAAFLNAFEGAGEPDQAAIDAHLAQRGKPQQPMKHTGVKRWYYLLQNNPRIRLGTIGRPLEDWAGRGPVKVIVGTNTIIGEFAGNREFVGRLGLRLTIEPIEWLEGNADKELANGAALLAEISEQILDRREINDSQRRIKQCCERRRL